MAEYLLRPALFGHQISHTVSTTLLQNSLLIIFHPQQNIWASTISLCPLVRMWAYFNILRHFFGILAIFLDRTIGL